MDWPTRTLRSRIVWLGIRVHYWRQRRRRRPGPPRLFDEPAWWSEFEDAFWAYAGSQYLAPQDDADIPTDHPPKPQPDA